MAGAVSKSPGLKSLGLPRGRPALDSDPGRSQRKGLGHRGEDKPEFVPGSLRALKVEKVLQLSLRSGHIPWEL